MEFPTLPLCDAVPNDLTEFRKLKNPSMTNQFIHFYTSDKNFIGVYNNPQKYLAWFKRFSGIIGFDFSNYTEFPLYKQVENIGKNRELSYWFAKQEIPVIPNVRWGLRETYDWCFDGLPMNSTLAVSTLGCSGDVEGKRLFEEGFLEMMKRLVPKTVIVYGTKSERLFPPLFICDTKLKFFESQYTSSHRKEAN
jgi:hypothetical protein